MRTRGLKGLLRLTKLWVNKGEVRVIKGLNLSNQLTLLTLRNSAWVINGKLTTLTTVN